MLSFWFNMCFPFIFNQQKATRQQREPLVDLLHQLLMGNGILSHFYYNKTYIMFEVNPLSILNLYNLIDSSWDLGNYYLLYCEE